MNLVKELDIANVNVKGERIKAIATIVLTAIFNIANLYGFAVDAEPIINGILTVISFVLIVYAWWKNQNVTVPAMQSQKLLKFLKTAEKDWDEEEKENDEA